MVGSVNKVGNDPGKGGWLYQLLRLENIPVGGEESEGTRCRRIYF